MRDVESERHTVFEGSFLRMSLMYGGVWLVSFVCLRSTVAQELAPTPTANLSVSEPDDDAKRGTQQTTREDQPAADSNNGQEAAMSAADQQATALARAAHKQAAAINGLPRFYYRVREWHGMVERMRARPHPTIKLLALALRGTVKAPTEAKRPAPDEANGFGKLDTNGIGRVGEGEFMPQRIEGTYTFAWDENHFLHIHSFPAQPARREDKKSVMFWTHEDSWSGREVNGKLDTFVRGESAFTYWKSVRLFQFSCYLRQTPRTYWWGGAVHPDQTISDIPSEKATWAMLPAETFGAEPCDVAESAERRERLWISKATGRVRGILCYGYVHAPGTPQFFEREAVAKIAERSFESGRDFGRWRTDKATPEQKSKLSEAWWRLAADEFPENAMPEELILLADYREVKPGVWIPFEEERVVNYPSGPNKSNYVKTRIVVEAVEFDRSLADTISELKPKNGDAVQDRRFSGVVVNYRHGELTDAEVEAKAKAAKARGEFQVGSF